MRVVHLCNLPLPPDHPDYGRIKTHPGQWVLNLALAQKNYANISPELVVQVPGATKDCHTHVEGIPVHYVAAPNRLRAATLFYFDKKRLAATVTHLHPDLVHAHGTEDAYLVSAQATRLPYVVTAQGLYSQINAQLPPGFFSRARVIEFIERRSLKKAVHLIAKSTYVANWIRRKYPHLQIHEVPNTFDPKLLEIEINSTREPLSIAFVGTIVPRKGVDILRKALEIVVQTNPSVTLHIFGNQSNGAEAYELKEISALQNCLGSNLHLHGIVPAIDVARKVANCQILVAPSREEMFGNQLIEALLVGTYALVSDSTAMAENIRRFGNGRIVPQENAPVLADAILGALTAHSFQSQASSTRKQVIEYMGPAIVAHKHLDIYNKIIA